MEQMNLFEDLFGEMMADLAPAAPKKEVKKGKDTKKDVSKGSSKKAKKISEVKVPLPAEIISVFAEPFTIDKVGEESDETTLTALVAHLVDEGFACLKHRDISFFVEDNKIFTGVTSATTGDTAENTAIDFSGGSVTVSAGQLNAVYEATDFTGKEADEISLADIRKRFCDTNPVYKSGTIFNYDIRTNTVIVVPAGTKLKEDAVCPKKIIIFGETKDTDGESVSAFLENSGLLTTQNVKVEVWGTSESGFAHIGIVGGKPVDRSKFEVNGSGKSKKVEEKYTLPLAVTLTGFDFDLSAEEFGGKEKISQKDLQEYLSTRYASLFRDPNRIPEFFYCEELHHLEILFASGTKGASFFR